MFEIITETDFSSAHRLSGYKGKCESLHGHNWKVRVKIMKNELNKIGLAIDFHDLKTVLNKIIEKLDHKYLNQIPYFRKVNPTSENLAKYIHDLLKQDRKLKDIDGLKVTVWESEKNRAAYYE